MVINSMEDLQVKLWEETGVDVVEQEILNGSGQTLEPHTLVQNCITVDKVRIQYNRMLHLPTYHLGVL